MSIYKVDPNLPNADKIEALNDMILELNGKIINAQFTKNDTDDLYIQTSKTRKYLRNQDIGNALGTYAGWTHLKAEAGYSIWKFSPTSYAYDIQNQIYMNSKALTAKGEAGSESATTFDSVFTLNGESGNTYHDYTTIAAIEGGAGFSVMDSTVDYVYIGLTSTFAGAKFEWQTRGSNYTLYLEFWNGSSWIQLTALSNNLVDGTSNLQSDGNITWTIPGTWASKIINGADRYWIRISTTSTPVTIAVCNYLIPANSVIGLLGLSSTDIQNENWAWCSYTSAIYVTIRNTGNSAYEGSYYITSASSVNNLKNFFISNYPFTGDFKST
jgi:hypothetical protein